MRHNQAKCLLFLTSILERPIINCSRHNAYHLRKFHSIQDNQHTWSILKYIHEKNFKSANKKYACLLLNISHNSYKYFEHHNYIWNEAKLKISVDGSTNCLADKRIIHTADIVCGDFDSIDAKLLEALKCPTKSTTKMLKPRDYNGDELPLPQVIETPHQKETDFTKAIGVAIKKKPDIHFFFGLYYSDGSRIDHLFALINTLHLVKRNIILVNIKSNTISWLLTSGMHFIQKQKGRDLCSVIPFTGPTEVKTQGLEYNLKSTVPIAFGGLISTSNICAEDSESIAIETNRDLLWSVDVSNAKHRT